MKKLLLSAIVLLATTTTFAATSGWFIISGTVDSLLDISIVANANATSLNITGGNSNLNVATVTETSNNLNGYKIMMRSDNASKLVHSVNSAYSTAYTVSYDGQPAVTLTAIDQQVKTSALQASFVDTSLVNVNVTPFAAAPAGTYSDRITISIVAL